MGKAAWGSARGWDSFEVAQQAAVAALKSFGSLQPSFGLVFAASEFELVDVIAGVTGTVGKIPLWGGAVGQPVTPDGTADRSVVVALLSGTDFIAHAHWLADYSVDAAATAAGLKTALEERFGCKALLLAADGGRGNFEAVLNDFGKPSFPAAGFSTAGDPVMGRMAPIAGGLTAAGGLGALALGGKLRIGIGYGHGWKDSGLFYTVSRVREDHLAGLEGRNPAEVYGWAFRTPAKDWAYPPLNEMVRQYPLGLESETGGRERILRSALLVEADGSFRMNAVLPEGRPAHLMTADVDACMEAAHLAALQAQVSLGNAHPLLALVLVDTAWSGVFEASAESWINEVQTILPGIPVIGGTTFGQVVQPAPGSKLEFLNNHLVVTLIGEGEAG